ncbi:MAG: NADase-type glycan-binding domain-containing protein [Bacteroidales bacterium]
MRTLPILFLFFINVCFTQTGIPEINTRVYGNYREISSSLSGSACSLACVMKWTLSATSILSDNGTTSYKTENMKDGLPNTAWAEGAEGYGIGEKIYVRIDGNNKANNVSFWGIRIANGFQKDSTTWKDNSRVKYLRVYHNSKPILIINLEDKMGVQAAKWKPNLIRLNNNDLIAFEIIGIYKGDKNENTAISDLVLDGAH